MPTITPSKALQAIREEYLSGFLQAGGSSLKFVLGSDEVLSEFLAGLNDASSTFQHALVSLAPQLTDEGKGNPSTHIHRMDTLTKVILEAVDVPRCINSVASKIFRQEGYSVTSYTFECDLGPIDLQAVAAENEASPDDVFMQVRRSANRASRSATYLGASFAAFVKSLLEFRLGLNTPEYSHDGPVVASWTRDVYNCVSPAKVLKKYRIYDRIRESNARQVLQSALLWRYACAQADTNRSWAGIVLVLDIRAYEFDLAEHRRSQKDDLAKPDIAEPQDAPSLRFTKTTFLKLLTVLRHLIDDIGRMPGVLVLVVGSRGLVEPYRARKLQLYDALTERVLDEVVDQEHPNPSSALLVLEQGK